MKPDANLEKKTALSRGGWGVFAAVQVLGLFAASCSSPRERACPPFVFSTKRFDVHAEEDSPGLREVARWAEDCLEAIEEVLGPLPAGVRPELLPFPEGCTLRSHTGSGGNPLHGLFEPGRPPRMLFSWGGCPVEVREILIHELTHWYASETGPRAAPWLVEAASEWLERELVADDCEETDAQEARRLAALRESRKQVALGLRPKEARANFWFVAYALCERAAEEVRPLGERLSDLLRMPEEKLEGLYGEYRKALARDLWKGGPPRRFLR